jgi:hypothetical protein
MLSAASDCTCASCSDSQGMLCFEVGDAFDAHAGGGGCKHASLDGHALLGWLAGKIGSLPRYRAARLPRRPGVR